MNFELYWFLRVTLSSGFESVICGGEISQRLIGRKISRLSRVARQFCQEVWNQLRNPRSFSSPVWLSCQRVLVVGAFNPRVRNSPPFLTAVARV